MTLKSVLPGYSGGLLALKKDLIALVLIFCSPFFLSGQGNDDVKKQADKHFKNEEYVSAYRLYSQLVANYPKDPEYNYRLGVCMIFSEPDKKKCLPYLKKAVNSPGETPAEAHYFLGKAYHINYRFDDAIASYNEFKRTASSALLKKYDADLEITACRNGKELLSSLTDLVILSKKELPEADYFRSYHLKTMNGKLLAKPDEFKLKADRKKKDKSIIYMQNGSDVVYFSSYGDKPETGRDIYTVTRLPTGGYSKPQKVQGINTPFDEDYPFLHPDGKTLYFASKGFNSMGGYDIFRSELNESNNTWGPPTNLEFPVNSPDDDYLFVTDSAESTAFFSTGRQSQPGKVDVLKVRTERRPIDIVAINGTVTKDQVDHSLASTITIKEVFGDREVGTFYATEDGEYTLQVPNAGKLVFTVETPGLETQSAQVTIPKSETLKAYRQQISYEDGKLKISNYFDEPASEKNYLDYLNVIEQKARLDVNSIEEELPGTAAVSNEQKENRPKLEGEIPGTAPGGSAAPKSLSNRELAQMARKDAEGSRTEAAQLARDAQDAIRTGEQKKSEAQKNLSQAEKAQAEGEQMEEGEEKTRILEEAESLKTIAGSESELAEKILAFGASLENDARIKEKEARLNEQYAAELEKTIKNPSKSNLERLNDLQQQIRALESEELRSESLMAELKGGLSEKENEISSVTAISNEISQNLSEINSVITEKENELASTKKKKRKAEISEQLDELKKEKEEKENQLITNEAQLRELNAEVSGMRDQVQLAEQISEKDIPASELTKTPSAPASAQKLSGRELKEMFATRIAVTDSLDPVSFEKSIAELNEYNKEIESSIAKNKADLRATKSASGKEKLSAEIKQLESQKKKNSNTISSHFRAINELKRQEELSKPVVDKGETYTPITTSDPKEALALLDELATGIGEVNDLFVQNLFVEPQARKLKEEATVEMVELGATEQKLQEQIQTSKESIRTIESQSMAPVVTAEALRKEADEITEKAQALRAEARNASGDRKSRLNGEARILEDQAADRNIEAGEITRSDNAVIVATNLENIQNLLRESSANDQDKETARKLNEEAVAYYRKASEIRQEISPEASKGAKLGTYSNAEEQESEAIARQNEAIELLMRSNPDFQLKAIVTTTTAAANYTPPPKVESVLTEVNQTLGEIASRKVSALGKLYQANAAEIRGWQDKISVNQNFVDGNTNYRREQKEASNKIERSEQLKSDADAASGDNQKINFYSTAIKQQTEAIQLMRVLNTALEKEAANAPAPVATTTTPVTPEQDDTITPQTPAIAENITPSQEQAENPVVSENEQISTEDTEPVVSAPPTDNSLSAGSASSIIDINSLASTDTTSGDLIQYFDDKDPQLANEDANNSLQEALSKLKDLEARNRELTAQANSASAAGQQVDPVALRRQADNLLGESDDLMSDSEDAKSESSSAKGDEKKALLAESAELEEKALNKLFESAALMQQANEAEYKGNALAISELLEKLQNDDPEKAENLNKKLQSLAPLKKQIENLRADAAALTNNNARLGAIGNAEEKEAELIKKQNEILGSLKKRYPDYEVKPLAAQGNSDSLMALQSSLHEDQYAELTNIINSLSLAFETEKNQVRQELTAPEQTVRQNAEALNSESKQLLLRSANENNHDQKIKTLSISARSGYSALLQLRKLAGPGQLVSTQEPAVKNNDTLLADIGKRLNEPEEEEVDEEQLPEDEQVNGTETASVAATPLITDEKGNLVVKGLDVIKGNAYSNAKPIPLNAKMEEGLIFRVQIGAFRSPIPNNAFKGLSPLNGETTPSGYIRYTAGNFNKIEFANAVKNDLRGLGYRDAFVVAYLNGRRITLAEALAKMSDEGIMIDANAPQSAGITSEYNVPRAAANTGLQEMVSVTKELEKINGLLYTIQIGVFNRQVTKSQLRGLRPIFTEELNNGLYRYTAGIYNNAERLIADKNKVVELGVKDAFISAYLNGERLPFSEAKGRAASDSTIRMEPENPIVFPKEILSNTPQNLSADNNAFPEADVTPFTNNVLGYPEASPENGIAEDETGITFKVQIGAYSKEVPEEVADKFSAIKSWPIEHKLLAGLYIYNVGNYSEVRFARQLRDEMKALGINDAFVTVYEDGKKLYGPAAEKYLR